MGAHSLFPQREDRSQERCASSCLLLPSDEVRRPQRWQLRGYLHPWLQEERTWMEACVRPPILLQERQEGPLHWSVTPPCLWWPLAQQPCPTVLWFGRTASVKTACA